MVTYTFKLKRRILLKYLQLRNGKLSVEELYLVPIEHSRTFNPWIVENVVDLGFELWNWGLNRWNGTRRV